VGPTSYLNSLRGETSYDNKPIWQIILGPTFICLVTLLGGILIYSFRNYEFMEENYLKRRFVYSQIFMLSIRNLLIISFYINFPYILEIKHLCIHIIGLSLIVDLYTIVPYTNEGSKQCNIIDQSSTSTSSLSPTTRWPSPAPPSGSSPITLETTRCSSSSWSSYRSSTEWA
jgi:hypothetical protein